MSVVKVVVEDVLENDWKKGIEMMQRVIIILCIMSILFLGRNINISRYVRITELS